MASNSSSASVNGVDVRSVENGIDDLHLADLEAVQDMARQNLLRNPVRFRQSNDQGLEGEFDTEEDRLRGEEDQRADQELERESEFTWSKEEILKYIEQDEDPENGKGFYDGSEFESIKSKMKQLTDLGGNPINVYKRLVKPGYGAQIDVNKAVIYNLNAYLEGIMEPFDSSWMRGKPFLNRLNQDPLVPGLLHALLSMRVGEKAEFIVDSELAYGKLGCPPRIPGESDILYLVEVIKVYEEGSIANFLTLTTDEQRKVSFEEIIKMCDTERIAGNSYFKDDKFYDAGRRYREAIRLLENHAYQNDEQDKKAKDLLLKLYCNLSNTFLRLNKPVPAMTFAKRALEINRKHAKALYFMGKAKLEFGDLDDACKILKEAYNLRPHDTNIANMLEKVNQRKVQDYEREKVLLKAMSKAFK